MSRLKRLINNICLAGGLLILLAGCTISRDYGPYKGRVVDAQTNEPIEGAVVFIRFYTDAQLSPGGIVPKIADAVEVLTDEHGVFNIPVHKVKAFRMFHSWDKYEEVTIFKPEYGFFPGHPGSSSDNPDGRSLFSGTSFVIVQLPKLKTIEERKFNISKLRIPQPGIPYEKQKKIISLINIESTKLGLEPVAMKK